MVTTYIILSCICVVLGFAHSNVISSPRITNFGNWAKDFDRCPEGTFAQGFQLLNEKWIGPIFDDTALNGIRLYCGHAYDGGVPTITSSIGPWGKWRNKFRCSNLGYIRGFQLRVEKASLIDPDETATNNVRIYCTGTHEYIEGDGRNRGKWSAPQYCPGEQVVCGIRTQVQSDRGNIRDDTSLNNVEMQCCDLPKN